MVLSGRLQFLSGGVILYFVLLAKSDCLGHHSSLKSIAKNLLQFFNKFYKSSTNCSLLLPYVDFYKNTNVLNRYDGPVVERLPYNR